jgi:hypothetical protein
MHDIVLIESFKTNAKSDIIVTAIVEDMTYVPGSQTLIDPPEYAPARCTITVPNDHLPSDIDFVDASEEELQEIVNKYANLDNYDWVIHVEDPSDDWPDEPVHSRLFF